MVRHLIPFIFILALLNVVSCNQNFVIEVKQNKTQTTTNAPYVVDWGDNFYLENNIDLTGGSWPNASLIDNDGNIYLSIYSTAPYKYPVTGSDHVFAKMDKDGKLVWIRTLKTEEYPQVLTNAGNQGAARGGAVMDSSGYIYFVGATDVSLFETQKSPGSIDGYVVKLNPNNGDIIWAKQFGDTTLSAFDPAFIKGGNQVLYSGVNF